MSQFALGLIETVGYATAVSAADAALKAANVTLVGVERVIGVGGALGVTIQLSGDVGAVKAAVEAGKWEAEKVGKIISAHVIARSHTEVNDKLLPFFSLDEPELEENKATPEPVEPASKKENKMKEKKQAKEKATAAEPSHPSDGSDYPEDHSINPNQEQ